MLALGVAACGSSDDSSSPFHGSASSSSSGGSVDPQRRRLDLRRARLPAGRQRPQGPGHDGQLPGRRLGRRRRPVHGRAPSTSPAPTRRSSDEEVAALKKGDAVHIPIVFGAITVSYNVPGVKTGLKLDGTTLADIFLGKIKKWNDPAIAGAEPGHQAARQRTSRSATAPTRRARPRASPTFLVATTARSGRAAPASTRRSSGRPAPAPRATTASPPRSSRPTAPSATSSRPTRCRTTSPPRP